MASVSMKLAFAICSSLLAFAYCLPASPNSVVPETALVSSEECHIPANLTKGVEHQLECHGIHFYVNVPLKCSAATKCGVIMDIHGASMTAPWEEKVDHITEWSKEYITIRPEEVANHRDWSGAGMVNGNWDDLHDIESFLRLYVDTQDEMVDRSRVHVAGFSQGGFLTFNLLCSASDLICSIAPLGMPATGKYHGGYFSGHQLMASARGHSNCWIDGKGPEHKRSIMYHQGKYDSFFDESTFEESVDKIKDLYGMQNMEADELDKGQGVDWKRYSEGPINFESALYDYKSNLVGNGISAKGHCFPSTLKPGQPNYHLNCGVEDGYTWGKAVLEFFKANPCHN